MTPCFLKGETGERKLKEDELGEVTVNNWVIIPSKGWLCPSMLRGKIRAGNIKQTSSAREVHEKYVHVAKKDKVRRKEAKDYAFK